jgi:methylthioribose-1-phosphate isomerase
MVDTMSWKDGTLIILDQTALPSAVEFITCTNYQRVCTAVKRLEVRGAPALGAAAGFAMLLAYKELVHTTQDILTVYAKAKEEIAQARPTAVNLSWGANLMYKAATSMASTGKDLNAIYTSLEKLAMEIYTEDIRINKKMGEYGAEILPASSIILTHCNAGALATCGWGTALGVIRSGFAQGKVKMVYADETRPLLQGARLTAWELNEDHIPVTLITDNMAATTMAHKHVNIVITGADRIAANGDAANKIGTYGVALIAKALQIPFYIAAPASTFDFKLTSGEQIPIEERAPQEVRQIKTVPIAPPNIPVFNPAFDVTPAGLISGIITEYGVLRPPYKESINKLHAQVLKEDKYTWKV